MYFLKFAVKFVSHYFMKKKSNFDWWENNVTSEIYLNTNRRDWWKACEKVSKELDDARTLVDIGGGDGHTLWQIISRIKNLNLQKLLFLEPSQIGIKRAILRLSEFKQVQKNFKIGNLETNFKYLSNLFSKEKTDVLFAGHVNYYFGKSSKKDTYEKCLEFLPTIANKVLIMTAPETSDYYKILNRNPFSEKVYSEYVVNFYKQKGFKVRKIKIPIRFFVAHIYNSESEAKLLYKFFNDTQTEPSKDQLKVFKEKIKVHMSKIGEINFKDELLIITQ